MAGKFTAYRRFKGKLHPRKTHTANQLLAPNQALIEKLDQVHGIDKKTGQSIVGHVGDTLTVFRSEKALASWAGLCPGNNESAGKRKSGKSAVRKHPFKELMIEIAWAAVRTKGSYYKAKHLGFNLVPLEAS